MSFKFFKLHSWGKRSADNRRRFYQRLPKPCVHGLRRSQYRSPWAVDRMPHTRSVGSRSQGDETGSVSARSVWQDGA